MKTTPGHTAGFTLAELLVAATLLSLVLSSVYFLFYSTMSSWRALEDDYDTHRDARNALTIIQRDISNIHRPAGHLFEGEDNEVTLFLLGEPMNVEEQPGRHLVRVRYRYNRSGGELVREEALVDTTLPKPAGRDKEVDRSRIKVRDEEEYTIATNVTDFSMEYIWLAIPDNRDHKTPPRRVQPIERQRHKAGLGLPHGIKLQLQFTNPEKPDEINDLSLTVPISPPHFYETESRLKERLEAAS